jgi:hypothetical protein
VSDIPCVQCGERAGTVKWYGDGGALAVSHGFYVMWCERCALKAQLAYAEAQAARIPGLRQELEALDVA